MWFRYIRILQALVLGPVGKTLDVGTRDPRFETYNGSLKAQYGKENGFVTQQL